MADKVLPDGSIVEANKPLFSFGVSFESAGQPTTPNLYRGVIEGTGIQFTNNSLAHACDIRFLFDFGKLLTSLGSGILPDFSPLIDAVRAGQNDAAKLIRGAVAKIIDALRFKPHVTHLHLDQTLNYINELKPRRALLTHMGHDFKHTDLCRSLPEGVEPAYDGLRIEL